MKNIQDIMNEMNTLSEQIAVTLNNEEIVDGEIVNENLEVLGTPQCATNPQTTCGGINPRVQFCCSINLPGTFVPSEGATPRILYDISCLKCIIEECCCNGVPKFAIRIFGCIPFLINLRADETDKCNSGGNVFLCCNNSVCVDNVVCHTCTYKEAVLACAAVETKLANCANVPVVFNNVITLLNCTAQVTGRFRLPNCASTPDPAI